MKHWIDSWRGSNIDFPKQWVCEWQSDQTKNIHQKSYDCIPKEGSRAAISPRDKWDLKSWQLVSVTQNYQMLKILVLLCVIKLNWTNYEGILLIFKMWGNSPGSRYLRCHLDLKVKSRLKRGRMNCQILKKSFFYFQHLRVNRELELCWGLLKGL